MKESESNSNYLFLALQSFPCSCLRGRLRSSSPARTPSFPSLEHIPSGLLRAAFLMGFECGSWALMLLHLMVLGLYRTRGTKSVVSIKYDHVSSPRVVI